MSHPDVGYGLRNYALATALGGPEPNADSERLLEVGGAALATDFT